MKWLCVFLLLACRLPALVGGVQWVDSPSGTMRDTTQGTPLPVSLSSGTLSYTAANPLPIGPPAAGSLAVRLTYTPDVRLFVYNGAGWEPQRTATQQIHVTIAANVSGTQLIPLFTPTAGKSFVVHAVHVHGTGNMTLSAAGTFTALIYDNVTTTATALIGGAGVYLGQTPATVSSGYLVIDEDDNGVYGNGRKAAAANNVLYGVLSGAFATGVLTFHVAVSEE